MGCVNYTIAAVDTSLSAWRRRSSLIADLERDLARQVETPQAPLLAAASAGILDGQTDKRLPIIGGHRG